LKNRPADINEAFEPVLLEKLFLLCDRLIVWNRKFALTSVPDDQIFARLIAPSAWLGLKYAVEEIGTVADFGTGPGIPGLAMALADPRNRYILIDSNHKKIGFIKHCLNVKGLFETSNVEARQLRVDAGANREKFDRVVTRGTGSMLSTIKLWEGMINQKSVFDFFKGNGAEVEIEELNGTLSGVRVSELKTPGWFGHLGIIRVCIVPRGTSRRE